RYQGEAALRLVAEARKVFPNTDLAADFASFSISRG
ncbi:ribonuclease Z, partial [Anoxybacillus geothermalis]|nr:ribonuclease Z [Anoxybacillus geothermalis]